MFTTTASRKVLVPLATLLAAGAVAIGSGATFSSETTDSTISATAGTVIHTNSADNATLAITDLKPGDSQSGTLTITNAGTLDSTVQVFASAPEAGLGDLAPALQIKIEGENGVVVYDNNFEDVVSTTGYSLGDLTAGLPDEDSFTVTVTVSMEDNGSDAAGQAIDNAFQNASAGLELSFVTTQTSDSEADQTGWDS